MTVSALFSNKKVDAKNRFVLLSTKICHIFSSEK